ncbi:energy transducer TonB [Myxococcus sp. RHSTA-1-4]|uniref:energy transducer TonB n=1 Tax=Myxococcus sp. RHSTA-1-4 TaxID=2874601 RepID=UPI001CBE7000|nr:energy transducer TonB [Myxococcus sp. RHSTA-1-4]
MMSIEARGVLIAVLFAAACSSKTGPDEAGPGAPPETAPDSAFVDRYILARNAPLPHDCTTNPEAIHCAPFEPLPPLELLEGPPIQYTPEAVAARVQGTMLVKCVITRTGRVRDCRVIKGLEPMNDVVVKALLARRYKPVVVQGKPVDFSFVFTIRLTLPR